MDSVKEGIIDRSGPLSTALAGEPWTSVALGERAAPRGDLLLARRWAVVMLDVVLAASGLALGYLARYALHVGGLHEVMAPVHPVVLACLGAVGTALTVCELGRTGLYRRRLGPGGLDGYLAVAQAATVAMAAVMVTSAGLQEHAISRLAYVYAWMGIIGLLGTGRLARTVLLARAYRRGLGVRRVVVVGATPTGKIVMQNMASRLRRGYQLLGFVGEHAEAPWRFGRFRRLGTMADLEHVLVEQSVDEVIVALPAASHVHAAEIVVHCRRAGVAVKLVPHHLDLRLSRVRIDDVAGVPLIEVRTEGHGAVQRALKRGLDVVVAALALVVAAPVLVTTVLAIRLDSPGPILFRQVRLGKDGHPFTILKFRSMCVDAEHQLALLRDQNEASGPLFKIRNDPRTTRVGRVIRKLSIDELPQLWNVLRGEMSLVGPRPPLAHEVAHYEDWCRRRLDATPGITCLWGVSGRSALDFEEMVMLDLYYIDNWSLGLDLRILLRTVLALLRPSGAY
jgi:exopolysaccharide biosynthesis polyprenyl glycosylphosphotransferase